MMKSTRITLLLLFSLTAVTAQISSLEEIEELATENALQLKIADKGVTKAEIGFRDAVGTALPSISAYGQATTNQELPQFIIDFDGPGPQPAQSIPMGSKYSNTAGISLSQPLFTGGAVLAGYRIAKESLRISEVNREMTHDNTLLTVRTFWYQLLLTRSLINATEEAVLSARGNLELVEKRYNAGSASQFELLQAEVSLEQLKPQLIQLKNQLKVVHANLQAYLNDPQSRDIEPAGELLMEENPYKSKSIDELVRLGLSNRNELQLMQGQQHILQQQRNMAYGQVLPMVSFSADLRYQAQDEDRSNMDYLRSRSTTVNVSIPLFTGGKKFAGIQKAHVDMKEAELQEEQTRDRIATEIKSMYFKVEEAEEKIAANTHLVDQAKEALRMAELMYENGSSTQLDVQNARSAVLQARSSYLSAIFEYNVALNQLKKSIDQL